MQRYSSNKQLKQNDNLLARVPDSGYNPLQGLLGTEEDQNEGRQIEPPPGATSHMLTAGTVSETLNSSSQQLTIEEYFTAPSNPKEYDGMYTIYLAYYKCYLCVYRYWS